MMNKNTTRLILFIMLTSMINLKAAKIQEMIKIPAGSYIMGSNDNKNAKPKHKIQLNSFYMDKYEVTQNEYKKIMKKNPSATKKRLEKTERKKKGKKMKWPVAMVGDKYPVTGISWFEAATYCNAKSLKEGLEPCYDEETWECDFTKNGYRLPSEAEWEYTCRAGSITKYYFGAEKEKLIEYANYWVDAEAWELVKFRGGEYRKDAVWDKPLPTLLPVGQKKPNAWGLYDMLGNAFEWCNDWFSSNYYKESPTNNPLGPEKDKYKVIRGDAFNSDDAMCRKRNFKTPSTKGSSVGFRCVRNLSAEEKKKDKKQEK